MSKTVGRNGQIGVEPVPFKGVETAVNNGFGQIQQKTQMAPLKVVFGDGRDIQTGDTVWVHRSTLKTMTKILVVDGHEVAICMPGDIVFVTHAQDA